jgi:hypothetical protein
MDRLTFEYDDVLLRVDDGIFELFRRGRIIGTYRMPVNWVKVRAQSRKKGVTRLLFGTVEELDEPLYASSLDPGHLLAAIEIQTADEPRYRAFFTELARQAGRRVGA